MAAIEPWRTRVGDSRTGTAVFSWRRGVGLAELARDPSPPPAPGAEPLGRLEDGPAIRRDLPGHTPRADFDPLIDAVERREGGLDARLEAPIAVRPKARRRVERFRRR